METTIWNIWVDNIKIDLKEICCNNVDWTYLAEDRDQWQALVNVVMNLWVPPIHCLWF
jgi:hypothetical protein